MFSPRFGWIRKETWKLYLQLFFSLSSRFFFDMVTPLHHEHLDPLVRGKSFGCLQNFNGVLLIREIFFSIQVFCGYLLFSHTQTFLQLRGMEHIMHIRQLQRQPQSVSYFTSLLQNLEWSTEPRCELASYLKTV
jgi:hypothetical protein